MFRHVAGRLLTAALGIALVAAQAEAQLAANFTSVITSATNGAWSLGWRFNVLAPVTVTQLGMFDDNGNGFLSGSSNVGIYNSLGSLLVSTTVTSSDALNGFFRMAAISPFALGVGNDYYIAGTTGNDNYTWNPNGFSTIAEIQFVDGAFRQSSTLVFPDQGFGGGGLTGWFGPTFAVSTVPEPSTYALMIPALLFVGTAVRRRRTNA
ncbi:DUF4082 domain-containing protein [Gemmatimonas sp.]|jgi:hypothetical protein|uniref:DUF4082 domain-containing protein n=1 Tax=Gemmatimonas sp. TaxID=1962908 RepID=UPI003341390B